VSYKSSIFMKLRLACVNVESVGLPSIMMRVDHAEVQCCGLSKGWNGGHGWNSLGDMICHAQIC
jgi:hypothetical protein